MEDGLKKEFYMSLIIPDAIKIIQSRFKINSNSYIPPFNTDICGPSFRINQSYTFQSTNADVLIFLKSVNFDNNTLGSASFCSIGIGYIQYLC